MTGCLSYRDQAAFGKNYHCQLIKMTKISKMKAPSYSIIRKVMMGVENDNLIQVFNQGAVQFASNPNDSEMLLIVISSVNHFIDFVDVSIIDL